MAVSGGLIGLLVGFLPTKPWDRDSPSFFRPPGLTSTKSTAQNYSRTHPLQPSNRRKKYKMRYHRSDDIDPKITSFFNNIGDAERSGILAWLSPLEPQIRHQEIRARRVGEVGDWLFQTEEYRNWFGGIRGGESNGGALFCYGGLGVGKTYIR